jgi:hypothetical protein
VCVGLWLFARPDFRAIINVGGRGRTHARAIEAAPTQARSSEFTAPTEHVVKLHERHRDDMASTTHLTESCNLQERDFSRTPSCSG